MLTIIQKLKNVKLPIKITVLITILVIISVVFLSWYFLSKHNEYMLIQSEKIAMTIAKNLADNSEYGVVIEDETILERLIKSTHLQDNVIDVFIIDKTGKILANKDKKKKGENYNIDNLKEVFLSGKQLVQKKYKNGEIAKLEIGVPIVKTVSVNFLEEETNSNIVGVVKLEYSLADLHEKIVKSRNTGILIASIILFLLLIIALILVRTITSPIAELVKGTEKISSGDFNYRIKIKDMDEIGILAISFNDMTENIKKSRDSLINEISERKHAQEELRISFEKLEKIVIEIINAMALTLETRDPYTAGHQRRATDLAVAIAKEMGLPKNKIDAIQMAGTIHDIGKIAVPAEILSKPARLTDIEYNMVKPHPQVGYNILKNIEFPWPIAQIVLEHQERINGSGYPQGLTGENILIEARILAVADVVAAMTSHRPYRSAYNIDIALKKISDRKGILFDPNVVEACLSVFKNKKFTF